MKTKILTIVLSISLLVVNKIYSQTAGILTVSFSQPQPTSPSGTKNVLAVWIETNSGTFIKTRMRFWGNSTNDHLPTWKTKSSQNVIDAITGPTLTSSTTPTAFGNKTVLWDGKDVNGTIVLDGNYTIWVESSWQSSLAGNSHNDIISFAFTKSNTQFTQTFPGDTYFNTITVDWTPSGAGINDKEISNPNISIYPNPFQTYATISYNVAKQGKVYVAIYNLNGQLLKTLTSDWQSIGQYSLSWNGTNNQNKMVSNGIYLVTIQIDNNLYTKRVIFNK